MWKVQIEIQLDPSVMNSFHCANSHKMPNQSIYACFGHIQYEDVSKSVEKSKNMSKISFIPLHRLYQFSLQKFS